MEKIIKQNWFKITLLIFFLLIVFSFLFFLKSQKQNALQTKCSKQAEVALESFENEEAGLSFSNFSQQNNYNKKMGECFVYITYTGPVYNGNNGTYWDLKDAFKNSDLAACTYSYITNGAYCFIGGGPEALDQEDINNFVTPRMGLNTIELSQ